MFRRKEKSDTTLKLITKMLQVAFVERLRKDIHFGEILLSTDDLGYLVGYLECRTGVAPCCLPKFRRKEDVRETK